MHCIESMCLGFSVVLLQEKDFFLEVIELNHL